jgi:hypothetical protein
MNLPEYIEEIGVEAFAAKFGVTERAAVAWKYRARRPRREVAQKIVANSPVSWDGIYGSATDLSHA